MVVIKKYSFFVITLIIILLPQLGIGQENQLSGTLREQLENSLFFQADSGNLENVRAILELDINPNVRTWDGHTPLMYAAQNGHYKVVREFVAFGADLNLESSNKITALHYATINNHDSIAELLILNGAHVHPVNSDGISPLHYSATYGYPFMTYMLLSYGAHIDSTDRYGNTSLLTAIYTGSAMTAEILLEQWADVDKSDNKGYTPLMVAAQFKDTTLVRLLTDYGANVNLKNNDGISAVAIAIANRSEETAVMLLKNGAEIIDNTGIVSYAELAKRYGLVELSQVLKNLGSPISKKPKLDGVSIYTGTIINSNDFYFAFGSVAHITNYGISSTLEFGVRPYSKAILVEKEYDFYQFFERRRQLSFAIEKTLMTRYKRLGVKNTLAIGLKGLYSWGSYTYHGALNKPNSYHRLSPTISYNFHKNGLLLGAQGYLLNMGHNKGTPLMVSLTLGYNFDLARPRIKNKKGEWF